MNEPITKDPMLSALSEVEVRLLRDRDEIGAAIIKKTRSEITSMREDLARYENGRVVLLAELETANKKALEAQQLAMRQANQIRQMAGALMRKPQ
jgi:hypothetical protein